MVEPERERGLAARAFAAILSPFRRRPTEDFKTSHIARSTPALPHRRDDGGDGGDRDNNPLSTWHSWGSELSIASKLADQTLYLSPSSAGQRRIRRSLSGTLVKRSRTPSVIYPQVAFDTMLGKRALHASPSQASLSTAPPQISLDFDWGPSASDLPSDALCATLEDSENPAPPSTYSATRSRGMSTSTSGTSVATPTKSKPKLRRLGSRRFSRSAKSLPVPPTPLPRIELELIDDGFCVNFAVVEEESAEPKIPGAWT
ncbi:hypothetical protein CcaverHIS631_0400580 [Cutaneotrichosporon cavernicola]|nr:hypothetical protein CcaverHIS631_0400580 [Cutaneotrichosporon cavernicola]